MEQQNPLVLEIKGNSLDDGPGIRSVVFFKGCPFSCQWCHNPESKKAGAELSFDASACIGCHSCVEACAPGAISPDFPGFVDRSRCTLCFDCTQVCPSGAMTRVGREMSIADILAQVVRDKPFFDASGGGVTLSGGEPTLNLSFLGQTAEAFKEKGIHVLLETCGRFNPDLFLQRVYPHLDLIYFDIKIMDPHVHKRHCGIPNQGVLDNFKRLYTAYLDGGIEVLPRTPLVPGITDTWENLEAIIELYTGMGVRKTQLLAYHPLWQEKNAKIGALVDPASGGEAMDQWMGLERLRECEALFLKAGIELEK